MRGIAIIVLTALLIIPVIVQTTEAGIRSRVSNYRDRSQRSSYNAQTGNVQNSKSLQSSSGNVKRGSGLSAWGIIGIILAAIIIATTGYYTFVFYPYLCKKERNYDMIELTNVV